MNTRYKKFVQRWEEVTDVAPQRIGVFTPVYRHIVRHLKVMPWPALILLAVVVVFFLFWVFGSLVISLASLLQRGF